jgi:hypothetical protein
MTPSEKRFDELLSLELDGVATDAERDELSELVKANPRLVAGCVETVFAHSMLQWRSEDISECISLESSAVIEERVAERSLSNHRRGWFLAAALVFIALFSAIWYSRQPVQLLAEIVAEQGVVWSTDSSALQEGQWISKGRLQNDAGSFTLKFTGGPTVKVAGPATLDIESAMLVHLNSGQVTARIQKSNKGFAIKTPVARVVDQGTEFGVAARPDGKTDVIVFEGRVDVQEMAGVNRQPQSLVIGNGARIDDQGDMNRIVQIGRNVSGGWWTENSNLSGHAIAEIHDNIVADVSNKFVCYQTTYGGLEDDTLAYADNPNHQWNGLTAEGMPEFLRGADYIKTFNDYRYRQDFEMTVVLTRPANLYVFADNRIPPPAWLIESFEDTGIDIGLDEGPWLDQAEDKFRRLDVNTTAVGGGESIDNVFSVWKRACFVAGPITLGDAGTWATEGGQGRAMYGIAATPLEVAN